MNFDNVINYLPKKRALQNEVYTKYDEIYSIWNLGNYLGGVLLCYVENGIRSNLINSFQDFVYNYKLIKGSSKTLSVENGLINDIVSKYNHTDTSFDSVLTDVYNLRDLIYNEFKAYSTHLANIFDFGFLFQVLHAFLLQKESNGEFVKQKLKVLSDSIDNIMKGDKKLESPNLEISGINLRILRQSLRVLNKYYTRLRIVSQSKFSDYKEFISIFFMKMLSDILLDIKNPKQYIRNKVIFIIIYYYAFVFILIAAVKIEYLPFYEYIKSYLAPLLLTGNDKLQFIILIIIPLISVLVILFRELRNQVIIMVIHFKILRRIKKLIKNS